MKIRHVNIFWYGLFIPCLEYYIVNYQIVIFNANFGSIKNNLLIITCYVFFQH
jgi:hypothetical protein